MPLIPFPDVPSAAGVPALARSAASTVGDAVGSIASGVVSKILGIPTWGIFTQDGSIAVQFDSFLGIRYRNGSRISKYPVEQGGFQSFNKVMTPAEASVRFACSGKIALLPGSAFEIDVVGSPAGRSAVLSVVDAMVKTTTLYAIVTPEAIYPSVNLTNYSYERSEGNASSLIVVELDFEEIMQTASAQFSSTQAPDGAGQVSNGQVQPSSATNPQVQESINAGSFQ